MRTETQAKARSASRVAATSGLGASGPGASGPGTSAAATGVLAASAAAEPELAARLEPFDSYWQAPQDAEKGFRSFTAYYRANYLPHLPEDRDANILVVSCGPGYLVNMLRERGYRRVLGIDSDPAKVEIALRHQLPCEAARAFGFLRARPGTYDVIIPEQELNHLTLDETIEFLRACRDALRPGGRVVVYAMNGANPLVGSENLSHNIDHFYNVTEYSLEQLLKLGGFAGVRVFPLKLYVFWKNPFNYVGLLATALLEGTFRVIYRLYGKKVRVLSKKIAAVASKP
ncbi:MAG TPA: class I SAM-dependent methyltransferase [Steroidobacteraceae bacterium]|nr:class I SAM-dependent methyltransferase [Steroidobacteraceae bacterium]